MAQFLDSRGSGELPTMPQVPQRISQDTLPKKPMMSNTKVRVSRAGNESTAVLIQNSQIATS